LIEAARQGKTVVRLKGGDPFIFGRGGEELEALRAAGIPYEVVPGVTAALAAGAYSGIPLTHRTQSSAVAFVTGHECPGKAAALDWAALARFPGTLVIYMGITRLGQIAQTLIQHGKAPDTPAAVVQWASTGRQATVAGALATIGTLVAEQQITAPAVTIIGPVVERRATLAWFEQRPLFGRTVLVTRPRRQAEPMVRQLENLGATVYLLPTVEIGPPPDPAAVQRVVMNLAAYDWLVFTSVNGVQAFLQQVLDTGRDLRVLGGVKLAAIGPRTAEALRAFHLQADLTPPEYRSESLAETLLPQVAGRRVLLARADRGREILREQLATVAEVEQLAVYSQVDRVAADQHVLALLRRGEIDFITLTSANIARAFGNLLDAECRRRLGQIVTISPVTSTAVRELGLTVAAEATEYTAAGVVEAVVTLACHFHSRKVSQAR
jgi:uroporphyrinogen III methyltransferase/synthase